MALNLVYPNAVTMREIAQDLIRDQQADDVTLKLLPVQPEPTHNVRWFQLDNYFGIMGMRGLDGSPSRVTEVGVNSYTYEPGVYGEYMTIGEREITTRAAPLHPELPIPLTELVAMRMKQLTARAYDRMRYNIWTLLGQGVLNIPLAGPDGAQVYQDTYSIQKINASVPWNQLSAAVPLVDFQRCQQLGVGHSADLGARSIAYANQVTWNNMLNNSNPADFGGRKTNYGATLNNLPDAVNYFGAQNLPKPQAFDDGYQPFPLNGPQTNSVMQFNKFIPTGLVIIVGVRPGNAPIGRFKQTLNAMGDGLAPGQYNFVKDYTRGVNAERNVPPKLEVHVGFNGGPVLEYPSSVVALQT